MNFRLQAATILAGLMAVAASGQTNPGTQLAWSADHLETNTTVNQFTAEYRFGVTNISDTEVIIDHLKPSCTCTSAKMPSQPWHLPPHAGGVIEVSVNLSGKAGIFDKTVGVYFADTNAPHKVLRVTVKMPDRRLMRDQNTKIAQADRQAVFKGDCAKCHAEPAKTLSGHALYREICGICHDAKPLASAVPNLHFINHPMDYDYWKTNIANGKPGTMMPAFAASQGGPLTGVQIDELAKDCLRAMPYIPRTPAELDAERAQRNIPSIPKRGTN